MYFKLLASELTTDGGGLGHGAMGHSIYLFVLVFRYTLLLVIRNTYTFINGQTIHLGIRLSKCGWNFQFLTF